MTAGRELDAAIGVLLGWKWMAYGYLDGPKIALYSPQEMEERAVWTPDAEYPREHDWDDGLPHYSTSDADALAALDAVKSKDELLDIQMGWQSNLREWYIELQAVGAIYDATGATLAEAVCRAILALAEATDG